MIRFRTQTRYNSAMEFRSLAQSLLFGAGALPYAVLTSQPTWRAHGGQLARFVGVRAGDHVLDLGCGPGESAFGMTEAVPGVRVTGLDLSEGMLAIARTRARWDPSSSAVSFAQGDAMKLDYPDASFDAVTGHSFLYLVPDANRVLAEVHRVLRPGRRCAFLEPASDAPGWIPREILEQTPRDPRFVASMALWRLVSRGYGRFDRERFKASFARAGLETIETEATLSGLGIFGVGRRPM